MNVLGDSATLFGVSFVQSSRIEEGDKGIKWYHNEDVLDMSVFHALLRVIYFT